MIFELAVWVLDGSDQPTEDPAIEWEERQAAFVPVAILTLPPQDAATAERNALAERVCFNS